MTQEARPKTGYYHFSFTSPFEPIFLKRISPYTCRLFKLKICYWTVTLPDLKLLKQYKTSEYHSLTGVRNKFSKNIFCSCHETILEKSRLYGLRKFASHTYNFRERKKNYADLIGPFLQKAK